MVSPAKYWHSHLGDCGDADFKLRPLSGSLAGAPRGRGSMSGAPIRALLITREGETGWPLLDQMDDRRLQIESVLGLQPAFERVKKNSLDLVLMDAVSAGTGLGNLRQLLQRHPGLPVVLLLSSYDYDVATLALDIGAIDVLVRGEMGHSGLIRAARFAVERAWNQRRQRFARNVLALFGRHHQLEPLLDAYLSEARALTGCEAGGIRLRTQDRDDLKYLAHQGVSGTFSRHGPEDPAGEPCLCMTALRGEGTPQGLSLSKAGSLLCKDLRALDADPLRSQGITYCSTCVNDGFRSNLLIPIAVDQQTYGVLQLLDRQASFFETHVIEELEQTTLQIGLMIERIRSAETLRCNEQRYRDLIDHASDSIFISGSDQRFLDVNRAGLEMLGYSREEFLRMRLQDLTSQEEVDSAGQKLRNVRRGESITVEAKLRAKDATLVPVEIRAKFLPDGTVLGMARDIRGSKQLQAQLAQSDRLASIGMLAAGVAHEINNPLTYVLYNLEMVIERYPNMVRALCQTRAALSRAVGVEMAAAELGEDWDAVGPEELDDLDECLRDAMVGAGRVRDIVRDLKVFSRVEEDTLTAVDLRQSIEGAINLAYNEIKYRAVLKKELPALLEVQANEGRLSQVFLNLLVNAAQAIDEGDANNNLIAVSAHEHEGRAIIEVSDSGKGMTPEELELIFEPFFTTKPAGIGSGLGLSICRTIVNSYGGSIEASSELGKGATFRVSLPVHEFNSQIVVVEKAGEIAPPRESHVLVVDDDPLLRMLVSRALGRQHEVQQAASGRQCLELIRAQGDFDLILCDVMMPEVTGIDVYATLREQRPELLDHFVFMTGGIFTPKAKTFLSHCPAPQITKPFELGELRSFVNGELHRIVGQSTGPRS